MPASGDLDIAKNIKIIEEIKSLILTDVALLYREMAKTRMDREEALSGLADIIINAYLLSDKLGIGFGEVSGQVISKLRLENIKDSRHLSGEINKLLEHLEKLK